MGCKICTANNSATRLARKHNLFRNSPASLRPHQLALQVSLYVRAHRGHAAYRLQGPRRRLSLRRPLLALRRPLLSRPRVPLLPRLPRRALRPRDPQQLLDHVHSDRTLPRGHVSTQTQGHTVAQKTRPTTSFGRDSTGTRQRSRRRAGVRPN